MEPPTQSYYFPNGLSPQLQTTTAPDTGGGAHHHQAMVYPTQSVGPPSAAVTSAPVERRKRGRPRKYSTPEQALAARKHSTNNLNKKKGTRVGGEASASASASASSSKNVKKFHQHSLPLGGSVGQGFAPHVINVAPGEDVGQKLMLFVQQSKREMCILSASGTISNVSLRQLLTSGGIVTYEGPFDIVSLSGSYVRTDVGGKSGGLSICLSSSDGQFIGGAIGGPLKAAGPVQVIVGTFLLDHKKDPVAGVKGDMSVGVKGDMSAGKLPSPVGGAVSSSIGFRSPVDSSGGNATIQANNVGGNPFLIQHTGMLMPPARPTDWRESPGARTIRTYDFSGRTGHGAHQSPEDGDYN